MCIQVILDLERDGTMHMIMIKWHIKHKQITRAVIWQNIFNVDVIFSTYAMQTMQWT